MASRSPSLLEFGSFTLDLALCELRNGGSRVALEPRVLDVLRYLIEHRDRLVSTQELLENVWRGTAVGLSAVRRAVGLLRRALEDDPKSPRWVSTANRRGYRFIGELAIEPPVAPVQLEPPSAAEQDYRRLFVGRGAERSLWRETLARARRGEGAVLLIEGEAGIGKSRLLEWCGEHALLHGVRAIACQCREDEGAPPLWPWMQAIRQLAASSASEVSPRALRRAAPALASLFPALHPLLHDRQRPRASDPRALRFQAYEAMHDLLQELQRDTPLALLFDDLHRADASSLALLEFLATRLVQSGVVFAGSMRPEGGERTELAALARGARCRTLPLGGLELADVSELLQAADPRGGSSAIAAQIWEQTGGNAFFVHQVLPLAAPPDAGGSIARRLPRTVRKAIEQQCSALSAPTQGVLRSAAVFGREFSVRLLAQALDRDVASVMDAIDEAVRAHVLVQAPTGALHYRYVHVLVRDVLYEGLGSHDRARLHGRAGAALEAGATDRAPLAAELAHHFSADGTVSGARKAIGYHAQAGEGAARRFDHAAALAHYRRALALFDSVPDGDSGPRCDLRIRLARQALDAGLVEDAGTEWLQAAQLARASGDAGRLVRVALEVSAGYYVSSRPVDLETACALLAEAVQVSTHRDPAERGRILARQAYVLAMGGLAEAAEEAAAKARPLVKESGDPLAVAELLAYEHDRRFGTRAVQERVAIARELLRFAHRAGDHALQLPYLNQLAANLIELGRFDEWDAVIGTHRRLAERLKSPQHMALAYRHRCMHALLRGEFADARAFAQQGLALVQHCDPSIVRELMTALTAVEFESASLSPQLQEHLGSVVRTNAAAELWVLQELGRTELVRQRIGPAAAQFRSSVRTFNSPMMAAFVAQAAACVKDLKLAEEVMIWFEGFEDLHVVAGVGGLYVGPALRYIGLLHGTLGRRRESIDMLEEALRRLLAIGSLPWAARVHLDLAEAYFQGSDAASGERAARHAREGLLIAQSLGMSHVERRAGQIRREG